MKYFTETIALVVAVVVVTAGTWAMGLRVDLPWHAAASTSTSSAPPAAGPDLSMLGMAKPTDVQQKWQDCSAGYVALTYDDGPVPVAGDLGKELAARAILATFFINGESALANPAVLPTLAALGHEIGNHSQTHAHLDALPDRDVESEIAATTAVIAQQTGKAPRLFRSPYGATTPVVERLTASGGLVEVMWTLDTKDFEGKSADQVVQTLTALKGGDVVLMHADSQEDIRALAGIESVLRSLKLCPGRIDPTAWSRGALTDTIPPTAVVPWAVRPATAKG